MSAPVDVLGVMRHAASALHGFADNEADPAQTRKRADDLIEVRAAVDDLIATCRERDEAQTQYDLADEFYGEDSNHEEMCAARKRIRLAVKRYVAALRRVGGAA